MQQPAFAVLLRTYRDAAALTQEQLAERSGVSVRAISDLERGAKTRPQRTTVRLLADGLRLSPEERAALEAAIPSRHRAREHADESIVLFAARPVPGLTPTTLLSSTTLLRDPTPFIGRRQEMADLMHLLDDPQIRLVTLTGPGGSGKTRLALELAIARRSAYADGAVWVSLAPVSDPALVAPTIATVLGITDAGDHALLETLGRALHDKQMLLVLDNLEHLLDAAPLVGELVRSCPRLQLLVTSRAILHLAAEQEYPVLPLSLPALTLVPDLDTLAAADAVALFLDRARAARPHFGLTPENAAYVAAICHRLDGLPLALELAAARIRVLPPQTLLERLSLRFELLTGGARDRPTRQQTLRGAIDWSYSLLSPEEQTLLARLSVFLGGWTLEAAEVVCDPEGELGIDVLEGMIALVEQSLVRQEGTSQARFGMLETIREYAAQRLEDQRQVQEVRRRHALFFLDFAERLRPELDGPDQSAGLHRLEKEHNNVRAAITWACDARDIEVGLRLAIASDGLYLRGYQPEIAGWYERLLAVDHTDGDPVRPSLRAEALQLAALYAAAQGGADRTRALIEESIPLIGELEDTREIAYRLRGAGFVLRMLGEYGRARDLLAEARSLFSDLGDKAGLGVVLLDLGDVARDQGDADRAIELCEESLRLNREVGNAPYVMYCLHTLGVAFCTLGDLDRSRSLCEEALQLCSDSETVAVRPEVLGTLASIVRAQGALEAAETLLVEALRVCRTGACEIEVTAMTLERAAGLAAARKHCEHAAVLFGAAETLRDRIGIPIRPVDQPGYVGDLMVAREGVRPEKFSGLWEEGHAMTVDQAIAWALGEPSIDALPGGPAVASARATL